LVTSAKVSKYVFIGLLLILTYFAIRLVQPFFTYVFFGLILTISAYPIYCHLYNKTKKKKLSSFITILIILLIIIIPVAILISSLIKQTVGFIGSFDASYIEKANNYLTGVFGPDTKLNFDLNGIVTNIKDFVIKSTLSIAGSVADVSLGLFIMFFIMYYGFIEGHEWAMKFSAMLPFKKARKEKLIQGVKEVTHAVLYGQILIAIIQGVLGGIGFFIVGIPSPAFWGFIMTVLAFIPVTGTGLVWLPAGIIKIVEHDLVGGIFIIAYGAVVVSGIDNILRPAIISKGGKIHPVIALIGVLGGLKMFGLLGIIIGPLIAALFITMAEFFYEDYVKINKTAVEKKKPA
jgi:predicted PurR-regulated permease PerM